MTSAKKTAAPFFLALLLCSLSTTSPLKVWAQQEMLPESVVESGEYFVKLAISADGKDIVATANNTNMLHMFHGNELQWTSSVGYVHALVMAANGRYTAVGAEGSFYLFARQNSTPQVKYQLDHETSLVAISADGAVTAVGATPPAPSNDTTSKLYLFEKKKPTPTWNHTLRGILQSLSISDDGDYIVASTTQPGALYLFAREETLPLWTYTFGEQCGGAKISNNGNYIVAVGGNQTAEKDLRIYRFFGQIAIPNYMKAISEVPSSSGIAISANGSVFAMSYPRSSRLIVFTLELPPYGYGPGSVLNVSLPSRSVAMSMSSDGRRIIVGTGEGLFVYEHALRQLNLAKQYAADKRRVIDMASSANGQIIAAAIAMGEDNENSTIYLFDSSKNPPAIVPEPWLQTGLLLAITLGASAIIAYLVHKSIVRRGDLKKPSHNADSSSDAFDKGKGRPKAAAVRLWYLIGF